MKSTLDALKHKEESLQNSVSNYLEDNDGIPTSRDIQIFDKISETTSDIFWTCEHLTALSEMKIIYIFKSFEITMKSLITTAYPNKNTSDFFQWKNMMTFFKSLSIPVSDLEGYKETSDLRNVNNNIKHSNGIDEEVRKIAEFSSVFEFDYANLDSFYNRIKPRVETFSKQIGLSLIEDLFVFDESRISKITDDYARRMDSETLNTFVDKLENKNGSKK